MQYNHPAGRTNLTGLENPLRSGLRLGQAPEPCTMVIFGASGDLTSRKLVPALYNLTRERRLPGGFSVVGFARRDWDDAQFRAILRTGLDANSRGGPVDEQLWESFAGGISYHRGSFDQADAYARLAERLEQIDAERGTAGNRVFYLATPPESYPEIVRLLGAHGLAHSKGWTRIIIEKPFGHDLASAQALNAEVLSVFDEDQVYRIDHYLGKETVQNIMVFRFANGIFEPIWNRNHIDHVQLTVAETVGVEDRGGYYDTSGALRDMIQNHLTQLVTLVAMEPPAVFAADAVRDEKVKVLRAVRPIAPADANRVTVRGQYSGGSASGRLVKGYREERGVAPASQTETYAALKLYIDNWRWAGVPFYLRSGKRLPRRVSEIAIQFKTAPMQLFADTPTNDMEPNVLTIKIQPDEGISLKFGSKVPGQQQIRPVTMDFRYGTSFGFASPEAYERLLLDCMLGDGTLFTRRDEVETSWSLISPILAGWAAGPDQVFPNYEAGTWGPAAADAFMARDGRSWRRL
jgi:glucose-6-phosphate 1-dehydrogenase